MNKSRRMIAGAGLLLVVALLPFLEACTKAPETIVWTAVSSWPKGQEWTDAGFLPWIEAINKAAKGRLVIQWKGGPEAVPQFAQMKPLSQGVFDVLYTNTAYHADVVPVALLNNGITGSPQQLQAAGYYDVMEKLYAEQANAKFLMDGPLGSGYALYLNKPVNKADFSGLKLRILPWYKPILESLGAAGVAMPTGDVYLAMQTGTIDGFAFPLSSFLSLRWQEVTKYVMKPFWGETHIGVWVNMDAWKKLPKDLQELVAKISREREIADREMFMKRAAKEVEGMVAAGMQVIELPPAEADKFLAAYEKAPWEVIGKQHPEWVARLKAVHDKLKSQSR